MKISKKKKRGQIKNWFLVKNESNNWNIFCAKNSYDFDKNK